MSIYNKSYYKICQLNLNKLKIKKFIKIRSYMCKKMSIFFLFKIKIVIFFFSLKRTLNTIFLSAIKKKWESL